MKVLKLGDLHIGVKRDDPWLQNIQLHGIRLAIEYSKQNNITQWLQLGDWFDVRQAITHTSMLFNKQICDEITAAGIKVDVIVGNHDAKFKNTLTPNACTELLTQFSNFTIYDKPTTVNYGGVDVDLIPWICADNEKEIFEFIKKSKSRFCAGHFELNGFYFYKGLKSHGIEPDFLAKYDLVESGHFHTSSEARNIRFNGTLYTLTAGDSNDVRGFWVFDTDTQKSEFVPNPIMWHKTIHYPVSITNLEDYRNLSVRVLITKVDANLAKFETALESVVHELKMVNQVNTKVESEDIEEDEEIKPLSELIDDYIDALPDTSADDQAAIKVMAKQLYLGATQ